MVKRQLGVAAALLGADLIILPLAWLAATTTGLLFDRAVASDIFPLNTMGGQVFSFMGILLLLTLAFYGQYGRRTSFWDEVRVVWRYVFLLALANFATNFFVQVSFTRTVTLLAWVFAALLLPFGRLIAREALISAGLWHRRALLVGDGENGQAAVAALKRERHMGIRVVKVLGFKAPNIPAERSLRNEIEAGASNSAGLEVEALARQLHCDVIVVALDDQARGKAAHLVRTLHSQRFEVFVVPSLDGLPVHGLQPQHFFSNDVLILRLQHKLLNPVSRGVKRLMDVCLASLALLTLFPLMAWVAWRIWAEDGGPVIYSHPRVGHGSQDFPFFKFRSMVRDADHAMERWKQDDPALYQRYVASNFKLDDDPRVLRVGRLIRRTSIDELPQLWNVLRGDMSLVGPRPLLRREISMYPPETLELYEQVKPGITGLWQVSGRSNTSFEQRASLDSWYVRNWSLWIDWVVLLKTVRVVLSAKGAV
jgi:Undecaprenyl-phosphate galactose phosphotransferase WbaP